MAKDKSLFDLFEIFEVSKLSDLKYFFILPVLFSVILKSIEFALKFVDAFCCFCNSVVVFIKGILVDSIFELYGIFLEFVKWLLDFFSKTFDILWHLILNIWQGQGKSGS